MSHDIRLPEMHVGLFIIPRFGFLGLAAVMEVMFQFSKRLPDRQITWETVATKNENVVASSGASVNPDRTVAQNAKYDCIIAFGAQGAAGFADPRALNWLRYHERHGASMGSVMSGAWVLAKAGLLNGFRCSVHWQELEAFREQYPKVKDVTRHLRERRPAFQLLWGPCRFRHDAPSLV